MKYCWKDISKKKFFKSKKHKNKKDKKRKFIIDFSIYSKQLYKEVLYE